MRTIARWSVRALTGIVATVALAALAGWLTFEWWIPRTLPQLSGRYAMSGVAAPARIVRDRNGVPHIYARTLTDAMFALGFVHAQDRLFQMEAQRRLGAGRMSEIAGSATLRFDRLMRVLGLYRRAQASYASLAPEARRLLDSYTAGVNAYLTDRREKLPPEFLIVGSPERWTPADSLVWGKLMAFNLATGWRGELLRTQLIQQIGAEKTEALFPPYPDAGPTTIKRERAALPRGLAAGTLWASLPQEWKHAGASNQWVVGGARTETGKPLLANDPHLGLEAPTLWYLVRIETPEITLAGASVPGVPAIILGHNQWIAWGVTTPYIDAEDLFVEKIAPDDPTRYVTPGGSEPIQTRKETIGVRFGSDVTFTVRETRHGPVLDDALDAKQRRGIEAGHLLVLKAPWLEPGDTTAEAIFALNRARNWDEFRAALAGYVAPVQNFVYADVDGNIGHYVPGRIPIRRNGDGSLPSLAWDTSRGWTGYIPFERLPHAFNPASGTLVNANNRIVPEDYPYFLSKHWGDHYRATRIEALLEASARHSVKSFAAIQGDHVSLMAREMLPMLLKGPARSLRSAKAREKLIGWDATMDATRAEGLLFTAWLTEISRRVYEVLLGDLAADYIALNPEAIKYVFTHRREWCPPAPPAKADCDELISASLEAAVAWIESRRGTHAAKWRWGDEHFAEMRHRLFSFLPLVGHIGTLRIAADGDGKTVNKAAMRIRDARSPFAAREGPGVRAIYDLADLNRSQFILSTGPSGHPFSPHYGNMLEDWRAVKYLRFAPDRLAAERDALGIIELIPVQ
jgi:penicillin amidase